MEKLKKLGSMQSQGHLRGYQPVLSTLIGRGISMFRSHWLNLAHSVAPPALLCHKEPAQGTRWVAFMQDRIYYRRPYTLKNQQKARRGHFVKNRIGWRRLLCLLSLSLVPTLNGKKADNNVFNLTLEMQFLSLMRGEMMQ